MVTADKKFIFSIDVDWIPGSQQGLRRLYDFCQRLKIKGTFFIAGKFAEAYPDVVREAVDRGHDVGTHGWEHGQKPEENFRDCPREDQKRWLELSTEAVARAAGVRPQSFRAPHLRIGETALELLEEQSYRFDSSVPARRCDLGLGQVSNLRCFRAPLEPYHPSPSSIIDRGESPILEIPPSAFVIPLNMSALRKLGLGPLQWAVRRVAKRTSTITFYGHPSEFVALADQDIPAATPMRHQKNIGPHNFELLERFVAYVRSLGYQPLRISDLSPALAPLPLQAISPALAIVPKAPAKVRPVPTA